MTNWKDEALKLRRQGVTYRDIAKTLGKPEGTINAFLAREKQKPSDGETQKPCTTEILQQQAQKEIERKEAMESKSEIRQAAQISVICDTILKASKIQKEIVPERIDLKYTGKSSNTIPVLVFSDPQAGTYISEESTGGLHCYDKNTLKNQMGMLRDGIVSISIKQLSEHPVLKMHMLGDMLEGLGIFPSQAFNCDMDLYEQFFSFADLTCKLLIELLQLYSRIEIKCVPGNHGRVGRKGEYPHYINWDIFWYKHLEQKMQNYKQITWDITKSWWLTDTNYDTTSLLLHGDGIKSWMSLPYYGIERADARYTKLFASMRDQYQILEMGHFHTPTVLPSATGYTIINGCFTGASIYALKDLTTTTRPVQMMFGVHKQHGKTWDFPIYLD